MAAGRKRGQEERRFLEIIGDPAKYARFVLGYDLWSTQEEILHAVAEHQRVAVKACHASSKTLTLALLILWWIIRHKDAIAITTAPTYEQVRKLLWMEIHRALPNSQICYPPASQTELRIGPGNYALGLSTNSGVRMQGYHSSHMLVVLDEAPGIEGDIWDAIEGARAGGDVHVVAVGNPTITGGPFYDAFLVNRTSWRTFTISAFDTPNLQDFTLERLRTLPRDLSEDDPIFQYLPRPYLITRRWVYEKFWEWGEKSPLWQSKVTGQFPEQSQETLIPLGRLESARLRQPQPGDAQEYLVAGVDVAGPGKDECVCYVRKGGTIVGMQAWSVDDPRGPCVAFLRSFGAQLHSVNVDSTGMGYNFGLHLVDQGFSVNHVNVGQASNFANRFVNLKAQYYWALRERFEAGDISGLSDDLTISQLGTLRWAITAQGKIEIESKEERRRRGLKSPDRAEALMLAFAPEHPAFGFTEAMLRLNKLAAAAEARGEQLSNPLLENYNRKLPERLAHQEIYVTPFSITPRWRLFR